MKPIYKLDEESALIEVKDFVEYYKGIEQDESDIKESYPYTLRALRLGLLTFDDKLVPTLKLEEPIETEAGNIAVGEVTFRTRLTTADNQRLNSNPKDKNNPVLAFAKARAFMIGQPVAMLEKFGRFDEKAILEITTLFL